MSQSFRKRIITEVTINNQQLLFIVVTLVVVIYYAVTRASQLLHDKKSI